MFSTDFIFRQQENLVDNQKCQAGFRPLCNKILCLSGGPNILERITISNFNWAKEVMLLLFTVKPCFDD